MNVGGVIHTNTDWPVSSECLQLAIDWLHFRVAISRRTDTDKWVCVYGMSDYKVVKSLKFYVWIWENNVGVGS